jgi:DNA-binding response OmpR family regulator
VTDPAARGLVLVVEDDRAIAELMRLYLRREGFGVQVEGDGAAALAAVARLRPVAVVLDVGLPGLDGIEVCRRLRSTCTRTGPIARTSSRSGDPSARRSTALIRATSSRGLKGLVR